MIDDTMTPARALIADSTRIAKELRAHGRDDTDLIAKALECNTEMVAAQAARIEALEAVMAWHSMESAPTDRFIWLRCAAFYPSESVGYWDGPVEDYPGGWVMMTDDGEWGHDAEPDAWMPLPRDRVGDSAP